MGAMKVPAVSLYEVDYHAWTQDQAAKLRQGDFAHLDLPNLVEEIESLGRSEERELERRLAQLLMHLLKWEHQPSKRTKSWKRTIQEQRSRIEKLLMRMPSLRSKVGEAVSGTYGDALVMLERETGLDIEGLPEVCPYTAEQVLTSDWLPSGSG